MTSETARTTGAWAEDATLSPRPLPRLPPAFAIRLALGTRRLLQSLADGIVPAHVAAFDQVTGLAFTHLVAAVARHGIADLLAERPMRAEEIAARIGADAAMVHRTLRALSHRGWFRLDARGRFTNGRLAESLRESVYGSAAWADYFASPANAAAWADFDETLRTGQSAFERVHGVDVWKWFDAHPAEREAFARAMSGVTALDAPRLATLYPFAEVDTVCDVGGGRGLLLSELLLRHPHLRGILCDAPAVLDSAASLLRARGVVDRVERVPGSFFERVPSGADAYVLKNVLHDWDDATCERLLRVVRNAMRPGQRIVVCELLLDHETTYGFATFSDVHMRVAGEGCERTTTEVQALLERAGFRRGRLFPSPTTSVIEGIAT